MLLQLLTTSLIVFADSPMRVTPVCVDGEINTQHCRTFTDNPNPLFEISGGGMMINLMTYFGDSPQAKAAHERLRAPLTQPEIQRAKEIYDQTQQLALATFLQGRTIDELSSSDLHLYRRLSTVTLNFIQSEPDLTVYCMVNKDAPVTGARYIRLNNQVNLCPADVRAGSFELSKTLAHELGHSIDPCSGMLSLGRVNVASEWFGSKDEQTSLQQKLKPGSAFGGQSDFHTHTVLMEKNILKIESPGIESIDNYPFSKTVKCLEQNSQFENQKFHSDFFDTQSVAFTNLNEREKAWYMNLKHCDNTKSVKEDFSDLFGREVMGKKLVAVAKKSSLDDLQVFSLLSPYIGHACLVAQKGREHLTQNAKDPHSSYYQRMEALISHPSIRKSIKCDKVLKAPSPCDLFHTTKVPLQPKKDPTPSKKETTK